ncbi:hypothetical protein ACM01_04580 [Streptomyces viridochromogenes]|uniref:Integral membrane protein n=1 Tax=Streptomyces viridochromogenes TaxID=1938 RepID=A0A0J7ZMZ1_STRVR|nr:hypothetical protein ACM01_04580 [Streptomyces viridochromogenes]KOG23250.1 hypothetical protein ADK35_13235 [Streptomyces viridochromogenes]KOG27146.1 hypothetical protein ADK36_00835 [Streptomyces viridochromogenes]
MNGGESRGPDALRTAAAYAWRIIAVGVVVRVAFSVLGQFHRIAVAVFLGLVVTAVLRPLAGLLARFMPRPLAVAAALIGGIVLVLGGLALVGEVVVMSWAVRLHPVVVAPAVVGGAVAAGVIGAVVAVPLVAVGWSVYQALRHPTAALRSPARSRAHDQYGCVRHRLPPRGPSGPPACWCPMDPASRMRSRERGTRLCCLDARFSWARFRGTWFWRTWFWNSPTGC